jgi:MYXO-CTERM domain-containing protein
MPWPRSAVVLLVTVAMPGLAAASPVLLGVAPGTWVIGQLPDGTSNTIQFGENTRVDVCVPNAAVPGGITDGTSNTIQFSETQGLRVRWASRTGTITDGTSNTINLGESQCFQGIPSPSPIGPPPGGFPDGSSNTIDFGEHPIDLRDRAFDLCFSNARFGTITDGSSNTIVLGEAVARRCFSGVEVDDALDVTVPAPAALPLIALAAPLLWRRRRLAR